MTREEMVVLLEDYANICDNGICVDYNCSVESNEAKKILWDYLAEAAIGRNRISLLPKHK